MSGNEGDKHQIHELSRGQLITWVAVGIVILLVGGNYLRGQLSSAGSVAVPARTSTIESRRGGSEADDVRIKVHVAGAVVTPGIYELEDGERTADAVEMAGGTLPEADLDMINLAARLSDGQQVFVPRKGEVPVAAAGSTANAGMAAVGNGNQPININTATAAQLEQLDGVGEKTAQKIVAYREEHGGFASIEELMEVPGIGPAKFEGFKDSVTV